ncbi:MAG: recombinase family protein [Akkermansiaceae bacterium]|nr:recombinase family protein [Akkermansiaceae bacterium]NNM29080.1 recombinase family protein [Akkermansiaceae bacterium]
MAKRVGIWLRVSTEDQVRDESPEVHLARAQAYADAKDWKVVEIYRLDATSGKSVIELPQAQQMLSDVRSGHITGLVFSKLARLARNTRELLEFSDEFQQYGADLISLQESIDTSTPAGRMFFTVIAAMAQWEREEIAERVAASVPVRAKMGKNTGGQATYGYQWKDGKLVPDPEEAPIRALVYELFLQIKTKQGVARALNEKGYRTRNGHKFSYTTVGRLLRDPTAKGVKVANYTKSRGEGRGWELKDESEWVTHEVEPVVSEEIWDQCNRILDQGAANKAERPRRPTTYLFSGYVYCGRCGGKQKLYPQTGWDKYRCTKCANKIPMDDLEELFQRNLAAFLVSDVALDMLASKAEDRIKDRQRLLQVHRKELDGIQSKIDSCFELFHEGAMSGLEVKEHAKPLENRKKQLQEEIPAMEEDIESLKRHRDSRDELVAQGNTLAERWSSYDQEAKRDIVEGSLDRIIVHPDGVEFEFNYIPGSFPLT